MEIFVVSFITFAAVGLLLLLGQRLGGRELPVGCTPTAGQCCMDGRSTGASSCTGPAGGAAIEYDAGMNQR